MQLPIGTHLQGTSYIYIIEKILGQGAFGITYLAKVELMGGLGQLESNIRVTIKEFFMKEINGREGMTVTSASKNKGSVFSMYRQKFAHEAKNLSKLKHPNIVNVMEYFEANNTSYYVMEYLSGGDLDTLIEKREGLAEFETVMITKQIGDALSFMHQNKMLHLDLKPKNIMLNTTADAILIDFGLSKQYNENGEPESSTTVGRGTPGYAPLEQVNYQDGQGFPVTMDVYALGATMYKMLTGRRAPEASLILNEGFPKDELTGRNVSKEMISVIMKAMSPMKKSRYQTVDELLKALPSFKEDTCEKNIDEETVSVPEDYIEHEHKQLLCEFLSLVKNNKIEYHLDSGKYGAEVAIEQIQNGYRGCLAVLVGKRVSSYKVFESATLENLRNQIEKWTGCPFGCVVAIIQNNATFYQYAKFINDLSVSGISTKRVMLHTDAEAFALYHKDCYRLLASLGTYGLNLGLYEIEDGVIETLTTCGFSTETNLLDALLEFKKSNNYIWDKDYYKELKLEITPSGVWGNQPWFKGLLKQAFGKELQEEDKEEYLSLHGGTMKNLLLNEHPRIEIKEDILLLPALPWTISVGCKGGIVTTLIDKDTTIPTKKSMTLTTGLDNQTEMLLTFTMKAAPRQFLKDNKEAISCVIYLENLPQKKAGELKLECAVDIDANMTIFAEISDHETKKQFARQKFSPYPPSLFENIDVDFLSFNNLLPVVDE